MKISHLRLQDFRRFTELSISDIPASAKIVMLLGPNGVGKSSIFDAFNIWFWNKRNLSYQPDYYHKKDSPSARDEGALRQRVQLYFHGVEPDRRKAEAFKKAFYVRTAQRIEPDFNITGLNQIGDVVHDQRHPSFMMSADTRVSENFQHLVNRSLSQMYDSNNQGRQVKELTGSIIGAVRDPLRRVLGDLLLTGFGNPGITGTFLFEKGISKDFRYMNLSGGEKAAFDLLLDYVIKRTVFDNSIICIDEPELHMHSGIQSKLFQEFFDLTPSDCQLWLASHSVGMLRRAKKS
jgi:predicted ATP-dependent endonuclease of OLD family